MLYNITNKRSSLTYPFNIQLSRVRGVARRWGSYRRGVSEVCRSVGRTQIGILLPILGVRGRS